MLAEEEGPLLLGLTIPIQEDSDTVSIFHKDMGVCRNQDKEAPSIFSSFQ